MTLLELHLDDRPVGGSAGLATLTLVHGVTLSHTGFTAVLTAEKKPCSHPSNDDFVATDATVALK